MTQAAGLSDTVASASDELGLNFASYVPHVVCCFVSRPVRLLRPETEAALLNFAPSAELVDVSGDRDGYWNVFARLWSDGRDFCNVEQDIEITAETIPTFEACAEPWCVFETFIPFSTLGVPAKPPMRRPVQPFASPGLTCVRMRAEVMRACPDALVPDGRGRYWRQVEHAVFRKLHAAGFAPHLHVPPLLHHRPLGHGDSVVALVNSPFSPD